MFTLTMTSLARAVLCDDMCATNQSGVQMTHLKRVLAQQPFILNANRLNIGHSLSHPLKDNLSKY